MKKEKIDKIKVNKEADKSIKKEMPVKNAMTDNIKNAALQLPGLNQTKTTRDDLLPSDGDNLTNT